VEAISHFFLGLVDQAGYAGLFIVMVLGNLGIPVGTELVVPAAGALAATGHLSSVWLAASVATAGEVCGAIILYAIGFYGGRPFVERYGRYIGLSVHKLDVAHAFYERFGKRMVFIGRFIPLIRGVASLPAGISRMQKRYFLTYTTAGSLIFCFGLAWLGSLVGQHFDDIAPYFHRIILWSAAAVVIVIGLWVVLRWNAQRKGASKSV